MFREGKNAIWAREEVLPREDIRLIQSLRLRDVVNRLYNNVPAYRAKMEAIGLKPEHIRGVEDLSILPFTTKQDMRDNYPYGMMAVDRKEFMRVHASSGTTGKPTVVAYTANDLDTWSECVARIAVAGGACSHDIAQICFGYGMFTGALGLHMGLEKVGATIVPSSSGNTAKQILYMKDFESSILVATPSYALRIAEVAKEMGLDPSKDLRIKTALLGSELMTEAMRREMYKSWGSDLQLTQNYGMSELMGPGVSGECLELTGMHITEDHFIAEIIDPKTGKNLPMGERGELVVSCISKEALPLIRYRTRDITALIDTPCPCGRTSLRMENLSGRTDDMIKVRGVVVFPSQIEEVLVSTEGIGPHYEIIVSRENHLDKLEIRTEVEADSMMDSYQSLEKIRLGIYSKLREVLGLDAIIKLVSPNTIQRFEGKAKRVTDMRDMN